MRKPVNLLISFVICFVTIVAAPTLLWLLLRDDNLGYVVPILSLVALFTFFYINGFLQKKQ